MTILNTIELTNTAPTIKWVAAGCLIGMLLFFIAGFICAGRGIICDKIAGWCLVASILLFFPAIVCATLSDEVVVPTGEYQYEVLIDDTTSFTEITEKYNIVEQRGEIFVLEDKE